MCPLMQCLVEWLLQERPLTNQNELTETQLIARVFHVLQSIGTGASAPHTSWEVSVVRLGCGHRLIIGSDWLLP